ncbi:hypothetical protein AGMMS49959_02110 [Planctomycetales bacterium]|nr:hypothetical protein AGMMS49959_02110 [Planctomycetales bacterium]
MFSYTDEHFDWVASGRRAAQRGTAMVEAILIVPPLLVFVGLLMFTLSYWQNHHIDYATRMVSEVAVHNSVNLAFPGSGIAASPAGRTDPRNLRVTFETEDAGLYSRSARGVFAVEDGLPRQKITITAAAGKSGELKRQVAMFHGINSWLGYPWLRGQFYNITGDLLDKLGLKDVDEKLHLSDIFTFTNEYGDTHDWLKEKIGVDYWEDGIKAPKEGKKEDKDKEEENPIDKFFGSPRKKLLLGS